MQNGEEGSHLYIKIESRVHYILLSFSVIKFLSMLNPFLYFVTFITSFSFKPHPQYYLSFHKV